MGWIWASKKSSDDSPNNRRDLPPPPLSAETLSQAPPLPTTFSPPPDTKPHPPPTRDEVAEAELRAFLRELETDEFDSSSPSNQLFVNSPFPINNLFGARRPTTTASEDKNPFPSSSSTEPPADLQIKPTNLYPATLSCRAAFDTAFYCQSLGGQFNAVYHYGTIRDCSPLWSNFWFCVKTNRRRMSDEERQGRVLEHYRVRETKYRVGASSEDVWVQRETMLVGAFEGDLEAVLAEEKRRKGEGGE